MSIDTGDEKFREHLEHHKQAVDRVLYDHTLPMERLGAHHILRNPVLRLTNRCNLRCSHCYQASPESMRRGKRDLPVDDVKAFIEFLNEEGRANGWPIQTIQLFGGETTLHPDFLEILEFIGEQGYPGVRISTNGVPKILTSEEIKPFFSRRDIEWRISLESHVEAYQNRIRPNNSYQRVVATIRRIVEHGGNVSVKSVLTRENLSHLGETLRFLRDLGVKQYSYSVLSLIGTAAKGEMPEVVDHREAAAGILAILAEEMEYARMLHPTPVGRWLKVIYGTSGAVYPRIQYFVDADGSIYPNDTLYENSTFCVGHISDPRAALDKLQLFQLSLESQKSGCRNCAIEPFCFRGNYGGLYDRDNGMDDDFPECAGIREAVALIMELGDRGREYAHALYR